MNGARADVAVLGSGLVGLAASLALAKAGLRVRLLAAEGFPEPIGRPWDARIYAIGPGSVALLTDLGAWSRVDARRVQPVLGMEIFGDQPPGTLRFDAIDTGVQALAFIAESRELQARLWEGVIASGSIELLEGARAKALEVTAEAAVLVLEDGSRSESSLVVGADGARSWIRERAGVATRSRAYDQTGVVANFRATRPHGAVARQWFRPDGILAMLPLPGNDVSMVWSATGGWAQELLAMDASSLCEQVGAATGARYGELQCIGPAVGFPLRWMDAAHYVQPRLALIGDAAHNVHPLAGQGVNLGFRDVKALADVMAGRGMERDAGARTLLRRYERSRREDVSTMIAVTDGLQRLFSSRTPGLPWLRNSGLSMVGRLPMLRHLMARHVLA